MMPVSAGHPKQELFVALAWTPGREDVLLLTAGEIEDEDSTLAERQEAGRSGLPDTAESGPVESAQALDEVKDWPR